MGEVDLVLDHIDQNSHVILRRVVAAVEPVYVTAVFRHLAKHVSQQQKQGDPTLSCTEHVQSYPEHVILTRAQSDEVYSGGDDVSEVATTDIDSDGTA